MSGNATLDIKPPTLSLHVVRPRTRHGPAMSYENSPQSMNSMFNFPGQFAMPPMHPFFMYPGQGMQNVGFAGMPAAYGATVPAAPVAAVQPLQQPIKYPDLIYWFSSLDKNEERNKDGIVFTPYGTILRNKGFLRLSQLTLDVFTLKDLQEWLGISAGSAVLIMQYAKQDIDDIKAGRLIVP
jgi:hypothetical protein